MRATAHKRRIASPTDQFRKLIDLRSRAGAQSLPEIERMIDPGLKGFGTAPHEIFRSAGDIMHQLQKEARFMPNGFDYKFHWIDERSITAESSVVTAESRITIPLADRTMIFDPVRLSAVYHLQDQMHKLVHWHVSFPDNSGSDEIFPGALEPKQYNDITVVFTDLVGFTQTASRIPPEALVAELSALFVQFDTLSHEYGLDKIKTIGDSYMAASGLCQHEARPAVQAVKWAQAALEFLKERNARGSVQWDLRVGMHTGPVVGGVLGTDKLTFDLWGDTVNVAKRIESKSGPNRINVSADTYALVSDVFPGELRGCCTVKGKREIDMYYIA